LKQWSEEKSRLDNIKRVKEQLEGYTLELQRAQRMGNLERASELMYSRIPELKKQLPSDKVGIPLGVTYN
jgi:ATP-dependent Clp protease ATP-binding subunit ClpB